MTLLALTTRRLAAAAALAVAGGSVTPALAQFVTANNYQAAPAQTAPQGVYRPAQPVYGAQPSYAAPPAYAQQSYGQQSYGQPASGQPGYSQPGYGAPQYRVAQTLPEPVEPIAAPESNPSPQPTLYAPVPLSGPVQHYEQAPQMTYGHEGQPMHASAYGQQGCATGDCNQGVSWDTYTQAGPGCDGGAAYGAAPCAPACNLAPARPRRQWFAGVYGLYMERDNPGKAATAVTIQDESSITTPYYPPTTENFLFTTAADIDPQWGGEIRFGSTFGNDPCGGCQPFAWEIGYWALNDDESQATTLITSPLSPAADPRIYGMIDYSGLEYDRDSAGGAWSYRPMNDYVDHQMPVENAAPNDIRVVGVRVRQNFQVQNLELNFWRFGCPVEVGGLGVGGGRLMGGAANACGVSGCGPDACGGGSGCAPCGRPPRRFFINGVAGVRYLRIDEDWQNAVQFSTVDGTGTPIAGEPTAYTGFPIDDDNVLFHDIETQNQLVGFQLGCSMNWLVGCKWNLFADSNFGVYGNDIDVYQRVYSGGGGTVRFVGDATNAAIRASRQDVSFLGELRAGVGYQVSCNCRLTAAYRLIGISGVALAVEQIPASFANSELLTHIDSNDSLVLHGLQTGVEWKY
ncbi:hypothetical protein [Botrimarina hoheduenensis]|uniref:Outer membrane protein beta-barrel domain-containing protein n=1 Tax=Botrimarina hoheduenensis TaxID=2528000 RepID=A0A5C5W7E8_9BACT|nr:hypothetical protein [Botrimarina hoheduenensis]TWT46534.1 hypothetical protein Pla111_16300 [Botrimarina hoheduenensis]